MRRVREMVGRFERSGLPWPLPLDLSDAELEVRLYGDAGSKRGHRSKPEPDWALLYREIKRNKHVTLETLWKNTPRRIRMGIGTAAFVSSTRVGNDVFRSPCARRTRAGTSCSSITPATRCRWSSTIERAELRAPISSWR
jgi:transposase